MLIFLLVAVLLLPQTGTRTGSNSMQQDVDRLVRAAEKLTGVWPSQVPLPIPEVHLVALHGKLVAPLLLDLLSENPGVQANRQRWKVHQQVTLALSRIYSESPDCSVVYCDGDPRDRIGGIKEW
jgi:hypothetical protein